MIMITRAYYTSDCSAQQLDDRAAATQHKTRVYQMWRDNKTVRKPMFFDGGCGTRLPFKRIAH